MKISRSVLFPLYFFIGAATLSGTALLNACKQAPHGHAEYKFTGDTIADGKALVAQNCAKCHKLVAPDMLTKQVWHFHALPSMAKYFGISTYGIDYYLKSPDSALLTLREYQTINAYYQKVAPDSLPAAKPPVALADNFQGFTPKQPEATPFSALTTMVVADSMTNKIYTSDIRDNMLRIWDTNLKQVSAMPLPSGAVDGVFYKDVSGKPQGVFTCIGQIAPMDFPNGKVVSVDVSAAQPETAEIASEMSRPVQSIRGDFNKDGLIDWVVLAQGNHRGAVYMLQQKADHSYTQSTITDKAGAVQGITGDFNNDGWPDLMILFGSQDEGLWLFLNDQKGGFTPKNLLQFPPVYGSSSFQLADLNHDGKPDLIYTSGYNFHDSRIFKPYHGLYIFMNQGDWKFKQSYFYPINGCTKAIAADFDGDGDLDIVTDAFFADYKNKPGESLIYFQQNKPMDFKPTSIPVSKLGRWMSMSIADYNHDGKPDILLGNYAHGFVIQDGVNTWEKFKPFTVLENRMSK